ELLEQVANLLVDFLRLADDQTEVRLELFDRARTADVVPGIRLNCRGDQLDQRIEVGLSTASHAARPEADWLRHASGGMPAAAERHSWHARHLSQYAGIYHRVGGGARFAGNGGDRAAKS